MINSLFPLAKKLRMPVGALIALPVSIEVFATKANMSTDQMIEECMNNEALRDYLAEICINAAKEISQ